MPQSVILASSSQIRQSLLSSAGVKFEVVRPRVDEVAIKKAMLAEASSPRDIADKLAEVKACKVSDKHPDALVIGCDQVLDFDGQLVSTPESREALHGQFFEMRGKQHDLLSAVVVCQGGKPVWRHVGRVRMTMRDITDSYLDDYINRNWESIRHVLGGYKLEEEGVRLFANINGDYFTVLGLPLVELLFYLGLRGVIEQ